MGENARMVAGVERAESKKGLLALFRNANFTLLWSSTLTSQLGDHLNLMALTALIFAVSGGAIRGLEFSKILLLASVPVLIFGPISGVYADRLSRKKLMIASDLLRAALVAVIPLVARSMVPVYVIVFLVFTINRFYLSAKSAAMPQIVAGKDLMTANSLLNVAMMATIMLGPWGGGVLVERFGYTAGFLADAGTYVASAILAAFITLRSLSALQAERAAEAAARLRTLGATARHALRAHSPSELKEDAAKLGREIAAPIEAEVEVIGSAYQRLVADLRDGVRKMRGQRVVVYSTISSSAIMFVAGFVLVACPVLVRNEFGLGTSDLGMLFSVGGVGMLIGSLVVGKFFTEAPRRAIIAVSFFVAGAILVVLSVAGTISALGAWIFALGFFVAPTMVTCDTILQEAMPGETVGKAFGFRDMLSKAAFGLAGVLSGIIADAIGPRQLLALVGIGCLGYALVSPFLYADTSALNLVNAYPLMRFGASLAAALPRRASYRLARALADLAYLLLPEKRRGARANAARVLGDPPGSRRAKALARQMFRSYGLYWADFFALNGAFRGRTGELVRLEGLDRLTGALERGNGVIFVTAHIGSWDMGGAALAATGGLPDLWAIVEPLTKKQSDYAMTMMREARGLKVIPLGKALAVGRALRRNQIVFVVGERLVGAEGVPVRFFGEETLFPRGAAYWAAKSGAAIVLGFCIRQADGDYVGHIEPAILTEPGDDSEEGVRARTQEIASVIERYIARYPEQWCMLQPVWGNQGERS
jgi:lauroyl/myristoyl acyltransferase/predicted MFS family arabinose efflux permease